MHRRSKTAVCLFSGMNYVSAAHGRARLRVKTRALSSAPETKLKYVLYFYLDETQVDTAYISHWSTVKLFSLECFITPTAV